MVKACQHGLCLQEVVSGTKFCAAHQDSDPNAFPWLGCLGSLVVLAVIIWVIIEVVRGTPDEPAPVIPGNQEEFELGADEIQAWFACQDNMDTRLKSPSTALYPTEPDYQISGKTYTFSRAWVDAENEFGADVRTYFRCTATYLGNDQWSVSIFVSN